ncbi:MAG: mevalonate kinase [Byssovorax sp.]
MSEAGASSRGSACGKVILLGEHAVVHGSPALAAGIDRGARAEVTRRPDGSPSLLHLGHDAIPADPTSSDARARAFAALLAEGAPVPPIEANASSDLPQGGGLGSSSALGVAIARAVEALLDPSATPPSSAVLARATAWDKVFHGNPSGVDIAAAAHGGCLRFSRKEGIRPLRLRRPLDLCIGWSGSPSSTREMVENVARLLERKPDLVETAIGGVTSLVENAVLAVEAGDLRGLGKLMDLNQMILAGLMLSTEGIEALCAGARDAGALGAKLTGGGGGGSVIALVESPEAASPVLAAWTEAGYSGFSTRISTPEPAR